MNGQPTDGTGWPWHLIGTSQGFIIDSAAGQMARPARDVRVDSILLAKYASHSSGFPEGHQPLMMGNEHGTVLCYQAKPDNMEFNKIDGFRRSRHNLEVAVEVIEAMKTF